MRRIRRLFAVLAKAGVMGLACMLLLEGALRVYPAALPLSLLVEFETSVRGEVAKRLALPTVSEQVDVARDDSGPRLSIFSPNQLIRSRYKDPGIVNEVQMDARGFCNPRTVDLNQANFQIVAIGDSFTWCTNVHPEDTWPSRLGAALKASIYNLGRPRTGLYEYIQLLKAFGLEKKPKLVVLNVYEGNDLRDAIVFADHARRRGETRARDLALRSLSTVGRFVEWARTGWVARNSYAYNFVFVGVIQGYEWFRASVLPRDPNAVRAGVPNFRYALRFGTRSVPFNPENADPDEVVHARALVQGQLHLDVFDAALDSIRALSRQHEFSLLVTYTPSAYTAYAESVAFADPSLAPVMAKNSDLLRTYFKGATASRGIAFLDLTPTLQDAARKLADSELLYYQTNVHLTAAGHRVVAAAIAERVAEMRR